MESSSVSIGESLRRRDLTRCFCGEKPVVVVLWTTNNPGRRFYGCPNFWVMSNTKRKFCFFYYYVTILVRILIGSIFDFIFRLNAIVNFSNGMMMKYVNVAMCLSQSRGKGLSYLRLRLQVARGERSLGLLALFLVISGICLCVILSLVG